jgi:endonuclease/exonuclease/phosphatase family metal-dependent hydrolase
VPTDSEDLLREFVGDHYVSHFAAPAENGVGGTLATRWPHRVVARVDLRITQRAREALPWTETVIVALDSSVGPLVVAHHKPSWPFTAELERERQAVLAAEAIEDHIGSREVHAVVLGDFDATPDSASMQFWRGRRPVDGVSVCYQDAWEFAHPTDPGFTFDVSNPLVQGGEVATAVTRKIDHILVRSGLHGPTLQVADCRRVLDAPVEGVWASDHFGVVADLCVPAGAPDFDT